MKTREVSQVQNAECRMQNGWRRTLNTRFRLLCFLLLQLAFCNCAKAQYSLTWSTIDGGGGTSTNGQYAVSGTVGQPDANQTPMSGGNFSLTGGFWALYALQTPGAPWLRIARVNTNTVVVFWPSPSTGWNLKQNTDLHTTNWVTPPEPVTDDGTNKFITVSPPAGNRFYRLHKP